MSADNRRYPRFHQTLDEEYQKALAAGPPLVPADLTFTDRPQRPFTTGDTSRIAAAALFGLAGGLLMREPLRQALHR